jgi:hypothetical protein
MHGALSWRAAMAGGAGILVVVGSSLAGPPGAEEGTPFDHVVLYGVSNQTDELVRYAFGDGQLSHIGEMRYADGSLAGNVESLGFIPHGPDKGLFAVDNYDGVQQSRLIKVSAFGALCEAAPSDTGFGNVEGMTITWDDAEGDWVVYASQSGAIAGPAAGNANGELHLDWWINDMHAGSIQPAGTWIPAFSWWNYQGQLTSPVGVTINYNLNARPAGLISGSLSFQNTSAAEAEIELKVHMPLAASLWGSTNLLGSAAVTLTTDSGGGSLSLIDGAPLYKVLVDGAPAGAQAMLYADPFQLQLPGLGSTGTAQSFGVPSPVAGPSAVQSLGLKVGLSLTPNDQASLSGAVNMTGNPGTPPSSLNLIRIDPASGQAALVMPLGHRFEGLARGPSGALLGVKGNELWSIDLNAHTVTLVGAHAYGDATALEFARGDGAAAINVPGVPVEWTENGALMGFSNQADLLMFLNPADGQAQPSPSPPGLEQLDGIVFLTELSDPYGHVVATLGD